MDSWVLPWKDQAKSMFIAVSWLVLPTVGGYILGFVCHCLRWFFTDCTMVNHYKPRFVLFYFVPSILNKSKYSLYIIYTYMWPFLAPKRGFNQLGELDLKIGGFQQTPWHATDRCHSPFYIGYHIMNPVLIYFVGPASSSPLNGPFRCFLRMTYSHLFTL